jgi:hypothetical protein
MGSAYAALMVDAGHEVHALNRAIPCLGGPLGVATSVNVTVVGIIRARERRMLTSSVME